MPPSVWFALRSQPAQMPTSRIRKLCTLDEDGERTLEMDGVVR